MAWVTSSTVACSDALVRVLHSSSAKPIALFLWLYSSSMTSYPCAAPSAHHEPWTGPVRCSWACTAPPRRRTPCAAPSAQPELTPCASPASEPTGASQAASEQDTAGLAPWRASPSGALWTHPWNPQRTGRWWLPATAREGTLRMSRRTLSAPSRLTLWGPALIWTQHGWRVSSVVAHTHARAPCGCTRGGPRPTAGRPPRRSRSVGRWPGAAGRTRAAAAASRCRRALWRPPRTGWPGSARARL